MINGYDPERDKGTCIYDAKAGEKPIAWIEKYACHVEGELAGKPLLLPDWQKEIVRNLYGWKRPDGTRRYREALIFVPRKNSKTTLLASLVLYELVSGGEPGAQIFSIAADNQQSALIHKIISAMCESNPKLASRLKVYRALKSIEYSKTNSIYKALSSEAGTKHGLNPSVCVADEIHAMPDRELIDVLKTGMGSRRQPLMVYITTADYARENSPCNQLLDYAKKVRDGVIADPSFLPAIWAAEKTDDWESELVWKRANPNYGLSVRPEFLREQCQRAKNEPSFLNEFLRLHLNVTTDSSVAWIGLDKFDSCVKDFDLADLRNQRCFGGLDLSSVGDLTAAALYFPDTGHCLAYYWMPEEGARAREKKDRVPYLSWADKGYVTLTPGNVIDYAFVRAKINELSKQFKPVSWAYDPWNATNLIQQLTEEDRIPCVEFRQGFLTMSPAAKEFERLLLSQKLILPKNPILRWNAANCSVTSDPAGNIKPVKSSPSQRIDGLISVIEAIGLAASSPVTSGKSIYESRGALVI